MNIIIKIKDSATLSRIDDLDRALQSLKNPAASPFDDVIEGIGKEW